MMDNRKRYKKPSDKLMQDGYDRNPKGERKKPTQITTKHVRLINEIGQLNVSNATIANMLEIGINTVAKYRIRKNDRTN